MSDSDARALQDPGRRRSFTVLAGLACLPLAGGVPAADAARFRWRGSALGARAQMLFADADPARAEAAARACADEVARLEAIFSLWRGDSELSRLNETGLLSETSLDLRQVLATALEIADASGGAFDPSVQPLWRAHAERAAHGAPDGHGAAAGALARARALVDWRAVRLSGGGAALARPGMALTLDGIAQGYITDRVADLLKRHGFRRVLVQLGETRALGAPPGRAGWRMELDEPGRAAPPATRVLADRALATSAGAARPFEPSGRMHHLLDPATGTSAHRHAAVTVEHARASLADGLSTALSVLPAAAGRRLLDAFGGRARWVHADGTVTETF